MFYRALAVGVFIAVCEAAKFPAIYLVLDGFLSDAISGGRILVRFHVYIDEPQPYPVSCFDNVDIMPILRTPYFVPEIKNIDALFFELQKERQHIAILIDEYGGFSGIVTMEDIIEEVMGDIDDEFDKSEESYKKINDNTYIINGKEDLDDINDELGTNLESDNSETIGGLIIDLLGEIPGEEDRNRVVRYRNYNFTILRVKERRIEAVRMEILQPNRSEDDESDE